MIGPMDNLLAQRTEAMSLVAYADLVETLTATLETSGSVASEHRAIGALVDWAQAHPTVMLEGVVRHLANHHASMTLPLVSTLTHLGMCNLFRRGADGRILAFEMMNEHHPKMVNLARAGLLNSKVNHAGHTLLTKAIITRDYLMAEALIAGGVDVNQVADGGVLPLDVYLASSRDVLALPGFLACCAATSMWDRPNPEDGGAVPLLSVINRHGTASAEVTPWETSSLALVETIAAASGPHVGSIKDHQGHSVNNGWNGFDPQVQDAIARGWATFVGLEQKALHGIAHENLRVPSEQRSTFQRSRL